MSDPTDPDSVARSMGLGGDLPPAPARPRVAVAGPAAAGPVAAPAPAPRLPAWRRAPARPVLVTGALLYAGYVFSWGDIEEESRAAAALGGGAVLALMVVMVGLLWWGLRHIAGHGRPFGRTVFNYGLVGFFAAVGILLADELLG